MTTMRRCPDCGVELEAMETRTGDGFKLQIKTDEPKEGILGGLGAKRRRNHRRTLARHGGRARRARSSGA